MNVSRPIDPGILYMTAAWVAGAVCVGLACIYMATRGQSVLRGLLYTIGILCLLLALPVTVAFRSLPIAWYGGKPDPAASVDGKFYVRMKHRLTPVSEEEFRWLQRVEQNESSFLWPCVVGLACLGLGRLLRPRVQPPSEPTAT